MGDGATNSSVSGDLKSEYAFAAKRELADWQAAEMQWHLLEELDLSAPQSWQTLFYTYLLYVGGVSNPLVGQLTVVHIICIVFKPNLINFGHGSNAVVLFALPPATGPTSSTSLIYEYYNCGFFWILGLENLQDFHASKRWLSLFCFCHEKRIVLEGNIYI